MLNFHGGRLCETRHAQIDRPKSDVEFLIRFCAMRSSQYESWRHNAAATYRNLWTGLRSDRHLIRKLPRSSMIAGDDSSLNFARWWWWERKIFRRNLLHFILIRKCLSSSCSSTQLLKAFITYITVYGTKQHQTNKTKQSTHCNQLLSLSFGEKTESYAETLSLLYL